MEQYGTLQEQMGQTLDISHQVWYTVFVSGNSRSCSKGQSGGVTLSPQTLNLTPFGDCYVKSNY